MPALGKVCPQCSSVEHCRRLVCVKCGYVFSKSASISKKKCMASARLCESEQESCVRRANIRISRGWLVLELVRVSRSLVYVCNPFIAIKGASEQCLTVFYSLYYNVGVVTAQLLISFNANNHFY